MEARKGRSGFGLYGDVVRTPSAQSKPLDRAVEGFFSTILRERIGLRVDAAHLPAPYFSTWSNFGPDLSDSILREQARLALSANFFGNDFANPQIEKSASEIWTYGGMVGGPIRHGKAFFFGSFEGLHYDKPQTLIRTIPTGLERLGDFSQTKVNVNGVATPLSLYDPFNVTVTGANVYSRALITGANTNSSLKGTNQYALNVLKNYPCASASFFPSGRRFGRHPIRPECSPGFPA